MKRASENQEGSHPPAGAGGGCIPPRDGQPIVELRGIGKTYGGGRASHVRALHGIDATVARGESIAIVGPSGSGKSTLLHILGCLDHPSEGTYLFDGRDTSGLTDRELSRLRNRRIGFVFQAFQLLPDGDALENVMLPLVYRGTPVGLARREASSVLEAVGLGHRLRHRPGELSGGEQQRVAIARALVKEPDLVLADEPTGNLDSATGEEILDLLEATNRRGITLVLITHETHVAARAGRVIAIRDGRLEPSRG